LHKIQFQKRSKLNNEETLLLKESNEDFLLIDNSNYQLLDIKFKNIFAQFSDSDENDFVLFSKILIKLIK
jgi:hypothetical protein